MGTTASPSGAAIRRCRCGKRIISRLVLLERQVRQREGYWRNYLICSSYRSTVGAGGSRLAGEEGTIY